MKKYLVFRKATQEDKGQKYILVNGLGRGEENLASALFSYLKEGVVDIILAKKLEPHELDIREK